MTKSAASTGADPFAAFQPMSHLQGAFLTNLTRSGEAYAEACLAWQSEIFRFAASRLQWDAKVGEALASCKSVAELAEVQKDWVESTVKDYVDEGNRLFQLANKLAPQFLKPFAGANEPAASAQKAA
jgi:hypothetical protein